MWKIKLVKLFSTYIVHDDLDILRKRRQRWCICDFLYSIFVPTWPFSFQSGPCIGIVKRRGGVIIVWDRDIIVMNSPILVVPCHAALLCTIGCALCNASTVHLEKCTEHCNALNKCTTQFKQHSKPFWQFMVTIFASLNHYFGVKIHKLVQRALDTNISEKLKYSKNITQQHSLKQKRVNCTLHNFCKM